MRWLSLILLLAACGHPPAHSTLPRAPTEAPARDLAIAKNGAPRAQPGDAAAKDPRVIDLGIIRITARSTPPGGDVEMEHVATADLFKQANEAAKAVGTEA